MRGVPIAPLGDRKFELDEDGRTCLHYAVGGGSLPVMRYLVDQYGLDLSLRTGVSCGLNDDTLYTPMYGCFV